VRFLKQGEVRIRVRWGRLTKNEQFGTQQRNAMQIRTNKQIKERRKERKEGAMYNL
jgi:hypothetical protein